MASSTSSRISQELMAKIIDAQVEYDPVWTQRAVAATVSVGSEAYLLLYAEGRELCKAMLDDFIRTGAPG